MSEKRGRQVVVHLTKGKRLVVYVSKSEHALIAQTAAATERTISKYIQFCLVHGRRPLTKIERAVLLDMVFEIRRLELLYDGMRYLYYSDPDTASAMQPLIEPQAEVQEVLAKMRQRIETDLLENKTGFTDRLAQGV